MQHTIPQTQNRRVAFVRAAFGCALVLCACCFLFVCWQSFLDTCWLAPEEHTTFHRDSLLWSVALLLLCAAVLWGGVRLIHRLHLERFVLPMLLLCTLAVGGVYIGAINGAQMGEPALCSTVAQNAAMGNWYTFQQGQYMSIFPFQCGFIAYLEGLYAVFGQGNAVAVSCVGLGFVLLGQTALVLLAGRISSYPQAKTVTALLAAATWPWALYATFNYGNFPSFTLVLWACLALLRFLDKPTALRFACVALPLAAAMTLKSTALIPLIAICVVLACAALQSKSWRLCISIVVLCVAVWAVPAAVQKSYETRTGQPLGSGTPKLTWISMGLEEGPMAMGWFNGKTYSALPSANMDAAVCAAQQKVDIAARLETFASDPAYARNFFLQKLNSQWLDPSFGSLYGAGVAQQTGVSRLPALIGYVRTRQYDSFVIRLTGAVQTLVYAMAALGMLALVLTRRAKSETALLAIIALGGFLYLMISEGKAQYAFSYYLLLLPYAAHGCCAALHAAGALLRRAVRSIKGGAE